MKLLACVPLKLKTPKGTIEELKAGETFTPKNPEAILPLIEKGLVTPVERVAYKIYSAILDCNIWVVETESDLHTLRRQGITEPVYTSDEITELKKLPKEEAETMLRAVHKAKQVFPDSKIEEIKKGNNED